MRAGNWYTLDNTAKLMPSMTNNVNTNVFRLACTLKANVDAKLLQEALDESLKEFPMFLYTMKDGIFWHYLEKTDIKPQVEEEVTVPCARVDNGLLFRLSCNKRRINLEVYHVLSDGNGSMEFLKYIVCTYLNKRYKIQNDKPLNESSAFEKISDDFKKFDRSKYKIKVHKTTKAYKLKFQKKDNAVHDVIEAHFNVDDVKEMSKKYNTTVTVYLTALLIQSIIKNARVKDLKKPIGIAIPVDLRNIFPSRTSRNFFYTMLVQYKSNEEDKLEDIINVISTQFKENTTKEHLQEMMNTYMIVQKIIIVRVIPNFLKDFLLSYISKSGKKGQTVALSNLGVIKLPDEYTEYVDSFNAIAATEDFQLTVGSFKKTIVLSFSSHIVNKEIERTMIKEMQKELDCDVKIVSNIEGESNE